jgi:anti-anti-sigma factor
MANLDPNGSSITVRTWAEGGTLVVSLSGELDLTNAERVKSAIGEMIADGTSRLVVDTSELEFMDSSGLALLASIKRKVPEIELRNPSPIVRRLIELTGLAEILNVSP